MSPRCPYQAQLRATSLFFSCHHLTTLRRIAPSPPLFRSPRSPRRGGCSLSPRIRPHSRAEVLRSAGGVGFAADDQLQTHDPLLRRVARPPSLLRTVTGIRKSSMIALVIVGIALCALVIVASVIFWLTVRCIGAAQHRLRAGRARVHALLRAAPPLALSAPPAFVPTNPRLCQQLHTPRH